VKNQTAKKRRREGALIKLHNPNQTPSRTHQPQAVANNQHDQSP